MQKDFKKLLVARFLFAFGISMQAIVVGWRMYDLTHDPLKLGLIGLAEAIPALSLALYGGYIVDRSRPLRIYGMVLLCSLISALIVLFAQPPVLSLSVGDQIIALYIASLVTGTARAFAQPSFYAIVPRLVPREALSKASAWMTSALQIARISGPALGGLIFGFVSSVGASAVICISLGLAFISVTLMEAKIDAPRQHAHANVSRLQELFSGVVYVFKHPILLPALSLDMISVFFGGVTAVLPIFASDILHVGPGGLGLLRASPAIGAAVTSLFMVRASVDKKAGPALLSVVVGFGVCILVFSLSESFALSLVMLGLSGAFDSVSMVIRGAAVQLASPEAMRGKISAVNSMFIGSSNELGEFESGVAAKWLGIVPSVVFGSLMCLLTVGVIAWRSPALRKMDLTKL